jgi:hypothetical protein
LKPTAFPALPGDISKLAVTSALNTRASSESSAGEVRHDKMLSLFATSFRTASMMRAPRATKQIKQAKAATN